MNISASLSVEETLKLASAERDAGRLDEAERLYRLILQENPQHADAKKGLDRLRNGQGEPARGARRKNKPARKARVAKAGSVSSQESTLPEPAAQPAREDIQALVSLYKAGQLQAAEAQARRLIEKFPTAPAPFAILGMVLTGQGELDEAVTCYRQAVTLKPDYVEAHRNLGIALVRLGNLDEAIASYRQALKIKPDFAPAHANLGLVLHRLGRLEEAVASYEQALKIKPDFAQVQANLGRAFRKLGRPDDAAASFAQALRLDPEATHNEINAHLLLPQIAESVEHLEQWRKRHRCGFKLLEHNRYEFSDPGKNIVAPSFRLAYHDANNAERMSELCSLFRGMIPVLNFSAPHIETWNQESARKRRIRIGFVSDFFRGHVIGTLYRGLIENLDRQKFELVVIHAPNAGQDETSGRINDMADRTIALSGDLPAQQRALAAEELDVLFYPDIGMSAETYFLAFSRLAPVQAVSWGHPDTSGLDSMDYYLSASCMEPEEGHLNYTERLIRLNRLPTFYEPPGRPAMAANRSELGLPETGALYGCPQNLVKFHPDFDAVLAGIAEQDPEGHIILIEGKIASWNELLRSRWARTFPVLLERVRFIPRVPQDRFLMLLERLDVLLDTVHFGSGNTLYEAMASGTPIVTWPGNYMRGRIVAGAYSQMGIADPPVAETLDGYAELAVTLAHDAARRSALRAALKEAAERQLFCDHQAVREFETFLQAAVAAARDNRLLPEGWRPGGHE